MFFRSSSALFQYSKQFETYYLTFWAPALAIIGSLVIDTKEDTEVHYPWTFIRGLGIFWRHCSGFRALKVLSQH